MRTQDKEGESREEDWEDEEENEKKEGEKEEDSQHEVLLPAWLVASHGNGGALDILHLQRHVGVKFLCGTMRNISVTIKQTSV